MTLKLLGIFTLPLLLLINNGWKKDAAQLPDKSSQEQTGTLERMAISNGEVVMNFDLSGPNGTIFAGKLNQNISRFQVAQDSDLAILVYNNIFRGSEQGSIALVPENT